MTNREIKSIIEKRIRYADEYLIEIQAFCVSVDDGFNIELTLSLDIDGENAEMICIMNESSADIPETISAEMRKKYKSIVKYFSQYFDSIRHSDKIVIV